MGRMGKAVIMDSLNGLVWIDGQKQAGPRTSVKFYGKDARRFKSQREVRNYAYHLAKMYNIPIFDRYYSKHIYPATVMKQKTKKNKSRPQTIFGFQNMY